MEDGDDRSKDFKDELNLQVLYMFQATQWT